MYKYKLVPNTTTVAEAVIEKVVPKMYLIVLFLTSSFPVIFATNVET